MTTSTDNTVLATRSQNVRNENLWLAAAIQASPWRHAPARAGSALLEVVVRTKDGVLCALISLSDQLIIYEQSQIRRSATQVTTHDGSSGPLKMRWALV